MDVKRLGLIIAVLQVVACASAPKVDNEEKNNFRNYALSVCVGAAFADDQVKADFNKSANGYMERGHMPIEAYEELRGAVQTWLQKDYPSKHGGQVNSAKCIDFYQSLQVAELFDKYDPCKSSESWLSEDDYKSSCLQSRDP